MKKNTSAKTLLVISSGIILLFLVFKLTWLIYLSLLINLIGAFSTWMSNRIETLWLGLSNILSKIIPKILLSIIFYGVLFPVSILMRLFKQDTLMLKKTYDSTFIPVDQTIEQIRKSMNNIW